MPESKETPSAENAAWARIEGAWRHLHGSFPGLGLSVEWHDFRLHEELDWGRSFHPGSLEICLNFAGGASFHEGETRHTLGPDQFAVYTVTKQPLRARRAAHGFHRFLTLEMTPGFLRAHCGFDLEKLKPPVRQFIELGLKAHRFLEIKALPSSLLSARLQFLTPPVSSAAHSTWYLGRVLQVLAHTLFLEEDSDRPIGDQRQRNNRERTERVRYLIERDLANPPSLEMLAKEVGCSPFYLSRIFAEETGASIPKYLRMKRMEKAAELLRTGTANVTEAAIAVGYSSLSAFGKAFVEQMGCCPGLYPHVKIRGRQPLSRADTE